MKAIVQDRYGSADILELKDVDKPVIREDELLLQVRAAGVGPDVWHLMTGQPYLVRLALGLRAPRTPVSGQDVAGVVAAVGRDATGFRVGDEVFGTCRGSFAEYAKARPDKCAPKPASLTFEQAAAVPISGGTALQALRDRGRVQPGQQVLIIGAGGGVGTFAVQLAKALGAEVTGVCSAAKVDLVKSIGADHVVDYTSADFADGVHRYDLIVDTAGNRSIAHLRRALTPKGTLVLVGGEGGGRWLGGLDRPLRAMLLSPLVGQQLGGMVATEKRQHLEVLTELIETGKVTPVIDRTFPLSEAAEAIRYLEQGHAAGKIVVAV